MKSTIKEIGLFIGGIAFGTAGVSVLSSKDAKKVYTHTTAAALRAKEDVMSTVTKIKENADDIVNEAKEINEDRAAVCDETIEDTSDETTASTSNEM